MTRAAFLVAGVLALPLGPWMSPVACAGLLFREPVKDAGPVRRGPVLAHRFAFVNEGPNAVEITDDRPSCGCLKPLFSRKKLQPGEDGWLELEVNTLSQPAGPNSWRVQVLYRDGEQAAETAVQLTADLVAEIEVLPAALNIVCGDHVIQQEIVVTDQRPQPLTITSVQASSPHLHARCSAATTDAAGHRRQMIVLEVAADYPEGRHDEVVGICTDDPAYREMRVPVTVVKRGRQRLAVVPERVAFEGTPGQPLPSRIVLLRDADNQAVIVEQATADDPALVCRWAQGPNTMCTLKILVEAGQLNGRTSVRSAVHVQVKEPVPQTVTIPVEVTLR